MATMRELRLLGQIRTLEENLRKSDYELKETTQELTVTKEDRGKWKAVALEKTASLDALTVCSFNTSLLVRW
jgi:hypothetical protein